MSERKSLLALAVGLVAAAVAALYMLGLGHPFGSGDEVIYAQNIREMLASGDYGILHWQGVAVMQRPALPFAIASLGARLIDGPMGLRLTSALFSLGTVALVFVLARRASGRIEVGVAAALLCAGAPTFYTFGRTLLSDPPFVFALTVALAGATIARERALGLYIAGAALGVAIAMKSLAAGPPAVALAPWLLPAARRHGLRKTAAAAGLFLLGAAPFFVVGVSEYGVRFLREHIGYSLLARARGELQVGMPGGAVAYLRYLWIFDGPITALWVLGGTVGATACAIAWRDRALGLIAGYGLALLVILSLIGTRLGHYLLPVFPAAAISIGLLLGRGLDRLGEAGRRPIPRLAGPLLCAAVMLIGMANPRPRAQLLPDPAAVELGRAARAVTQAPGPIYALDWYPLALGYYSGRDLRIVTSSQRFYRILDDVDFFHEAGVPLHPPPRPPGSRLLVAGPAQALAAARWLHVDRELAHAGDFRLVLGQVVDSAP